MIRYHIANSPEPLKEGSDLYALCGDLVPKAAFKAFMDDMPQITATLQMNLWGLRCRCRSLNAKERYTYIVCSGQEAMTAEAL